MPALDRRRFLTMFGLGAGAVAVGVPLALDITSMPVGGEIGVFEGVRIREALSPVELGNKLSRYRQEMAREYVKQNLFSPFHDGDLIHDGVIIRTMPEGYTAFLPSSQSVDLAELGVTEWTDDEEEDEEA